MFHVLGRKKVEQMLDIAGEAHRARGKVPGWKLSAGFPYVDGTFTCSSKPVVGSFFRAGTEVEERCLIQAFVNDWATVTAHYNQRSMEYMASRREI